MKYNGHCLCFCAFLSWTCNDIGEVQESSFKEVLGGDAEGNHRFNWVTCKGIAYGALGW